MCPGGTDEGSEPPVYMIRTLTLNNPISLLGTDLYGQFMVVGLQIRLLSVIFEM